MVGRLQMPQLAGMADQADRPAAAPRHRGQPGIMGEDGVGGTDGGPKPAMEQRACQQVKPDHCRRHGDQPDTVHA